MTESLTSDQQTFRGRRLVLAAAILWKTLASFVFFTNMVMAAPVTHGPIPLIEEIVYVESPTDTDDDGQLDRIYLSINRPAGSNLPVILTVSPYESGYRPVAFHDVDVELLPQDGLVFEPAQQSTKGDLSWVEKEIQQIKQNALSRGYASLVAHSLGTGRSTGCPTIGDRAETEATKAVIEWLGGRAKAFSQNGREVVANWASGAVGMTGTSYLGTLPNMVATTGVEGLKAIVPVAAISSWYNYYRANGLVVGPGGYVGEDADSLAKYIVRRGTCAAQIARMTHEMGRNTGDFTQFWHDRDYVAQAANVRAAVFVVHGQSDWNVRQRHAIEWWEALEGVVPRRMWLHKSGHSTPARADYQQKVWAWFDRYVKGEDNGAEEEPSVEVESPGGQWAAQEAWPHETSARQTFYLAPDASLSESPVEESCRTFTDTGRNTSLETMLSNPAGYEGARLVFSTDRLTSARLFSGTPEVTLNFAVLDRKAANITVAIVEYDRNNRAKIITRGWADPQNFNDLSQGELLVPGDSYQVTFQLEPKQHTFAAGSRIGVLVTATDYDHTVRPRAGTAVRVCLGESSYVELRLSPR